MFSKRTTTLFCKARILQIASKKGKESCKKVIYLVRSSCLRLRFSRIQKMQKPGSSWELLRYSAVSSVLESTTVSIIISIILLFKAKNERDTSAIAALLQTLKLDPGNAEAIMALAASFTNESMQLHGCYALLGESLFYLCRAFAFFTNCYI